MISPKLCTLLLCDAVAQGPYGRKTLYGVFHHVPGVSRFPFTYPSCAVYAVWGFGTGTHRMNVEIVGGEGSQVVFALQEPCEFTLESPLSRAEVVVSIQGLTYPEPGTYFVRVELNGRRETYEHMIFIDASRARKP